MGKQTYTHVLQIPVSLNNTPSEAPEFSGLLGYLVSSIVRPLSAQNKLNNLHPKLFLDREYKL